MRAAVLEEPGKPLILHDDVELQEPGPGQVRVRVRHCGICHSDLSVVDGAVPGPLPIVLGHEAAGVIDAIGSGVTHVTPGDSVVLTPCPPCGTCYWCIRGEASHCELSRGIITSTFTDGTTGISRGETTIYRGLNVAAFAEQTVVDARAAVRVPEDVPLDVACVIGCAVQTGVGAVLNTAHVEEGATVLVLGLGGIGLSVVQGAQLAGAARIFASDPVPARRAAAAALGATDLLDPGDGDVVAAAQDATDGIGVDYAFEAAGHAALIGTGFHAARVGGTLVCVGAPRVEESLEIAPAALFTVSGKRILGCLLGSCHSLREIPRLIGLWQRGRLDLDSLVTGRRPLAEINEAMDDVRSARGIRTVLEI